MKKLIVFCVQLLCFQAYTQELPLQFKQTLKQGIIREIISSGQKEFFITDDGERIIFLTDQILQLRDGTDGSMIISRNLLPKKNWLLPAVSVATYSGLLNQAARNFKFPEGAGLVVFPDENVMLLLDWNAKQNLVKAFDLSSGEQLWESDQHRFTADLKGAVARALFESIAQQATTSMALNGQHFANDILLTALSGASEVTAHQRGHVATAGARAFVTPLFGTGTCLLRVGSQQVCLNLRSGEEQWRYAAFPLMVGFHRMLDARRVLLVNQNNNLLQKEGGSRTSVVLDVTTGEELIHFDPIANFRYATTHVVDNYLVIADQAVEAFDLTTGKRTIYTLQDESEDPETARPLTKRLEAFWGSEDESPGENLGPYTSNSLRAGDHVYTAYAYDVTGTTVVPAPGGTFTKDYVTKIDVSTGERQWTHEKLDKMISEIPYANEQEVVVVKRPPLGTEQWLVLDASTGELKQEMKMPKGYAFRAGPSTLWEDERVYYAGKQGIHLYGTADWKEKNFIATKELKLGKMQTMIRTSTGIMVLLDKGIAFFDPQGELVEQRELKKLRGAVWNDTHCLVFTKDKSYALSLQNAELSGTIDYSPTDEHEFYMMAQSPTIMTITDQRLLRAYRLP